MRSRMRYRLIPSENDYEGYRVIDDDSGKGVAVTLICGTIPNSNERLFADALVAAMNRYLTMDVEKTNP